jgi:DNA polymerase-3 subunit delta'
LALAEATRKDRRDDDVRETAAAAEGSVGRALSLLEGQTLALRQRVLDLLEQLPNVDTRALHALGDAMGGTDPKVLEAFMDLINGWLSARLGEHAQETSRMARIAETWERVNSAARDVDTYNLERKPLVFSVFGALADAARP